MKPEMSLEFAGWFFVHAMYAYLGYLVLRSVFTVAEDVSEIKKDLKELIKCQSRQSLKP